MVKKSKKTRPCLVLSSGIFNNNSGLVTVVPITNNSLKKHSTCVDIDKSDGCINKSSRIKVDQIRTIDASRIGNEIGRLPDSKYKQVKEIIKKHLNL